MGVKSFGECVLKCEMQLMCWRVTLQYILCSYHQFLLDLITCSYLFTSDISFRNMNLYHKSFFYLSLSPVFTFCCYYDQCSFSHSTFNPFNLWDNVAIFTIRSRTILEMYSLYFSVVFKGHSYFTEFSSRYCCVFIFSF